MNIWMDVDIALASVPVNVMPLIDDTDFKTRETAVAYNAAGMDLVWNFVTTAGVTTQTAVTPTTAGTYDWAHAGDGIYTIEIPASGGASINNDTEGFGWFSGIATGVLPWRGPIIGFRAVGLNNLLIDTAYSSTLGLAGSNLDAAVSTRLAPTVAARTLDVSAGGEAGVDWANVGSPTTTVGLSGTTVKTATDVETDTADIQTRIPAALTSNGNMKSSVLEFIGTLFTEGATGRIADAFKQFFNITSPTSTMNIINTVTNLTNAPTTGDLTSTMKASVTAAVPTAVAVATQVQSTLSTELSRIDVAVSTRAAPGALMDLVNSPNPNAASSIAGAVRDVNNDTPVANSLGAAINNTPSNTLDEIMAGHDDAGTLGLLLTDIRDKQDDHTDLLDAIPTTTEFEARTLAAASYATASALNTVDDFLDTEVAAIKAKTDLIPAAPASTTNITAGVITTVTNLTNAPTSGDLTATMKTSVGTAVQTVVETNHLDHLLAADYDPASKPGVATALFNEMVGSDAGVSQWTANALELGPSGGTGLTAAQTRDALGMASANLDTQLGTTGVAIKDSAITSAKFSLSAESTGIPSGFLEKIRYLCHCALYGRSASRTAVTQKGAAGTVITTQPVAYNSTTQTKTRGDATAP